MPITTLLIDLDDTLYPPSTGIWELIGDRIELFIHERLGLPWEEIPTLRRDLFTTYGTTMRGLVLTRQIDPQDYLVFVHDVPIETLIEPDPTLLTVLSCLPQSKMIFTNSDERHTHRVLRALRLEAAFEKIIDINQVSPYCKPMPEAYLLALKLSGATLPENCLVVDDNARNLESAAELGFRTVLVGTSQLPPGVDCRIPNIKELARAMDETFGRLSSE